MLYEYSPVCSRIYKMADRKKSKKKQLDVVEEEKLSKTNKSVLKWLRYYAIIVVYIKIMKTTFDFNFDVYLAFKQHRKHGGK